jgi:hypothetical protein
MCFYDASWRKRLQEGFEEFGEFEGFGFLVSSLDLNPSFLSIYSILSIPLNPINVKLQQYSPLFVT